jgi:hypothetical protein
MKKLILSIALFVGLSFAAHAQDNAAGNTNSNSKPKSIIEVAKPAVDQASTPAVVTNDSTAKKTTASATEKKCAKKSCCKKEASSSCDKDKAEGSACCKKKTEAATKKD